MNRSASKRLLDIVHATGLILEHAEGLDAASLDTEELRRDAALFRILVVGEAIHHLPPEIRALAPEMHWERVRGMRNRIAHAYWQIDLEVVADSIRLDVPLLRDVARKLLQITERAEQ